LRLLLDTHVAIWAVVDDQRLSAVGRELLLDPLVELYVSVASLWEIAIKHALQRGIDPMPIGARQASAFFRASGFVTVPVTSPHVLMLEALPQHHSDPFDRLLVATALAEPFRLITADTRLAHYGPQVTLI
jgi:PIN domain nuclease of toxin-antitoxin system